MEYQHMRNLRRLPAPTDGNLVETGPVQFGQDYPGVFFRNSDAFTAYFELKTLLDFMKSCDTRLLCCCAPDRELDAAETGYYRDNPCPVHPAPGDKDE